MRAYYRMISGIDKGIARVLAALQEAGLADNTIIVYSADNGYYCGDRGFQGKWSHFEESLRVPMVIYDPRLPKEKRGRVTDEFVLNVDLPATFIDWADAEASGIV
jgi:arylsulfatase A-like enzyme